jgi:ribonucleotide monophosphatase NagD (HAD superfamily)
MSNTAVFDLIEQVVMNLNQSGIDYKEYLQTGKTFRHARILKVYNEKIRELLIEKGYLLSDDLQEDALALVTHYDAWLAKWNDLKEKLNPSPDEEFIFANEFTFPKKAAVEYNRLKELVSPE